MHRRLENGRPGCGRLVALCAAGGSSEPDVPRRLSEVRALVDSFGNMSIGYTASSSATEPRIAYAGRLAGDPANSLGQGEAVLIAGGGHQTSSSGRWGDYSSLGIDPADNNTFWHTNEYYSATSGAGWNTRIGKYRFAPLPQLAVSRKSHGGVNDDIPLPFTGNSGVECRRERDRTRTGIK